MIILIDGYNVLKQIHDDYLIGEQQRHSFIKRLALYQRVRKHKKIITVFDGGGYSWPSQEKVHGITVVYSGVSQTADEYINSFIKEHRAKAENMLLVSSDRELCAKASGHGVTSIDAREFYNLVRDALQPKVIEDKEERAIKLTQDSSAELDELMQEAAQKISFKPEDWEMKEPKERKQKRSKAERALLKKYKKL